MFKKTFYTFLALGALIIIGSVTSGFISTTTATEITPETTIGETLSGGKWIFGEVNTSIATIQNAGSGDWTIKPRPYYGGGDKSKVTIISNSGSIKFTMITTSGSNTAETYDKQGEFEVILRGNNGGSVGDNPDNFKFMAYVED